MASRKGIAGDASLVLPDGRNVEYWDGGDREGRPVLFHPGTPVTRVLGRWANAAAVDAGVRLIAVNRAGYGGSTPIPPERGLLAVGRDTASLASALGLDEFAVCGSSGGGPFAVATAIAAPSTVRAVAVVGGVGPWRLIEAPSFGPEDRACLALADDGDAEAARECLALDVRRRRGHQTPDEAAMDIIGGEDSAVATDPAYRALWTENMRVVLANIAGYVFDNLAWGRDWDVDPRDLAAPTFLLYGSADRHCSAAGHGQWYAERIATHELVVLPGAPHFEVIDGHWPEVLAGLLHMWA